MIRYSLSVVVAGVVLSLVLPLSGSGQETQRQYLSGRDKDHTVPWRFNCTSGANSGVWTNLPVPSHWDMHGFGTLTYKKDATNAWDEHGLYEHEFTVPADWADLRVFLTFEGVMTDTTAELNGNQIGPTHQGGFYRFKYEVTRFIKPGQSSILKVDVARHSANDSVNNAERLADYWVFAGIYRPVYLESVPKEFIERVAIDARHDGVFAMDVYLNGIANADGIEAQIQTLDGEDIGGPFGGRINGIKNTLRTRIASPKQWTAETPNLYQVEVRLKQRGRVVHRVQQHFGFRTMEVRNGDGLYVNGSRVILKGVDRHSFWPDSGRCLSEEVHRLDIETMKDMNMNAVRMSHYPPDAEFLDLCDELGLYVLDELAGWHRAYDTEVGTKLVEEMITRDVNHPCILFWDNGNEGGWNKALDDEFSRWDPQGRRVLHPWGPFNGVNTSHYLAYENAKVAATGAPMTYHPEAGDEHADTNDPNKYIYMPTEFLHGLYDGGAGAGMQDYWSMMTASPFLGGGFVWVFGDEGVKRPDTGEIDTAGNQAPDGIVGPYRQREGSFYTIKELWSPIIVTRKQDGNLLIQNRYSFTDASRCKFAWQLRRFVRPDEQGAGFKSLADGKIAAPSIPPGGTANVNLELPETATNADALAVTVNDPNGRELWTWVWPLNAFDRDAAVAAGSQDRLSATERGSVIQIECGELAVEISKETGLLNAVRRGASRFSLANGPRPATGDFNLARIDHGTEASDVIVEANYEGALVQVVWRVGGDGWIHCDYRYRAKGPMEFHGVAFDYPEELVKGKRWLGDGPYRVWKNRMRGTTLGVWQNDYNNTITGFAGWVYPEFKGCFGNVRWMQLQTAEGLITIIPGGDDEFIQVLSPEQPPERLVGQTKFNLPDAGLAVLDAIPPIGTKFKPASQGGPQGQLSVATGEYAGSVSFFFGDIP